MRIKKMKKINFLLMIIAFVAIGMIGQVSAQSTTKYRLTVDGGTGSGEYPTGTVVQITANTAREGYRFYQWWGDASGIADINAEITTFTVGNTNASITAVYWDLPETPMLKIATNSLSFEDGSSIKTVNLTTNTAWIASSDQEWVTVSPVSGTGNAKLTITVLMNTGESRVATITVKGTGVTAQTITISQSSYTSIEQVAENDVKIHTEGSSLILKSDVAITSVEVYAPLGQTLRSWRGMSDEVRLDDLPSGILFVRVTDQGCATKVIKTFAVRR